MRSSIFELPALPESTCVFDSEPNRIGGIARLAIVKALLQ